MEKYHFKEYNSKFPKLFQKEKIRLKKLLGKVMMEHIGSTAVPNLKGKGIIDIVIGVDKKNIPKFKNKLIEGKYVFLPKAGEKNRLFFERDYKYCGMVRRVHLHLTYYKSDVWKRMISVRDYLKKHPREKKRYEKIKKDGVMICKGEGKIYREYKNKYLNNLTKESLKNVN
tara:strand:+ start:125 stop:637 length:513 start_codon:yes stop_codon:yes gene_type:complete